jgi:hypothetical protein
MARIPSDPNAWVPGVTSPSNVPALSISAAPAYVGAMTRGFPRAETPVQEWVPGVSTPEGLIIAGAGAAAVAAVSLPAIERVISTLTGLAAAGISTGVPVSSVWVGMTFLGGP